jgi:glucosyl-dolichyl phosphate glucuronosyltransferase
MKLDVLVTTFERPQMLARTLESMTRAPIPAGLTVTITVIENDPRGEAEEVVRQFAPRFGGRVDYVRERRKGKSHALNTGILLTGGDLIGIVDDDEEIDPGWYAQVEDAFRDERVDYIGGPCLPMWGAAPPAWMPSAYRGAIGHVDDGDRVMVFGKDAPGILMGGNAVVRRSVMQRVGLYSPRLGPTSDRRLMSGEDEDLYVRLLGAGTLGLYLPGLKIYHFVPPERLTKRYYRQWCFWNGVSRSVIEHEQPSGVVRVGKVPRYLYGSAVRGLMRVIRPFARIDAATRFGAELAVWHVLGFVYGSYFRREQMQ